jgi:hypothetical protein
MPMPSVTDLQTAYGSWNPQAYLTAQSNADLERQFRESEYGRQQELTKQAGLETVFQEQNNPIRLEQGRLTNQNLGYTGQGLKEDNRVKAVNADIAEQTKQYKLNDAQRKELLAVSENDIAMGEAQARRMMMSLNPEERKQGEQLYSFTKYARDEKTKHDQAMEKERYIQQQQTGRLVEQLNANKELEGIRQAGAASRATAKQSSPDFWATFNSKLKTARDRHAALIAEATRLGTDSPDAQVMLRMAEAIRPQAEAEIASAKPGGIDASQVANLPAVPSPQIAPRGNLSNIPRGKGTKEDPIVLK